MAKIFVGDIPHFTTEDNLRKAFREYGEIRTIDFRKKEDGKDGYAFITFVERASAEIAVAICKEQGQRVWQVITEAESRYEAWLLDDHVLTDNIRNIVDEPILEWEATGRPGTRPLPF